jgi:GTPase
MCGCLFDDPLPQVRKGMVLVDEKLKPAATWGFDADIAILTHSTTIQPRYQVRARCTRKRFGL